MPALPTGKIAEYKESTPSEIGKSEELDYELKGEEAEGVEKEEEEEEEEEKGPPTAATDIATHLIYHLSTCRLTKHGTLCRGYCRLDSWHTYLSYLLGWICSNMVFYVYIRLKDIPLFTS